MGKRAARLATLTCQIARFVFVHHMCLRHDFASLGRRTEPWRPNEPGSLVTACDAIPVSSPSLRVVNDTMEDGCFDITLVAQGLNAEKEEHLLKAYETS